MSADEPHDDKRVVELIEQIRQEARLHRTPPAGRAFSQPNISDDRSGILDFYLSELARLSEPRSELPRRFRRFPFSVSPIRNAALRMYNLLTRQQRASNVLVRDALQALQSMLTRNERAQRETGVVTDYVRALLPHLRRPPAAASTSETRAIDDLDAFYVALEERFRGAQELIRDRLGVYLPLVSAATVKGPAADLGCGRGEWLELMRDAGVETLGVELNPLLVAECRNKGLHVLQADFQTFLEQSPAEHWQLLTGFHVIEHLGWPAWYACLRHMHRALQPGGMAILETPNPGNLYTAANRFYLDPTHRHPLPDSLLQFAATSAGFLRVEILPLHPEPVGAEAGDGALGASGLAARLTGAQDYALIARK